MTVWHYSIAGLLITFISTQTTKQGNKMQQINFLTNSHLSDRVGILPLMGLHHGYPVTLSRNDSFTKLLQSMNKKVTPWIDTMTYTKQDSVPHC